ncbi:MAG: leucine-rich repeat domain-containing protein [Treponema sp.]|uniref:leucine-rich repeat domain-containing protein n=1 Tax=Treponema sp. TaxID=166 RepID=UPI0025DF23DE|nr:leucine-rich repeat domain-containing protein [Treponema sp.]MBQ9282645.1 leucine-rich repeat domain-containing protein [Treponema sp.]
MMKISKTHFVTVKAAALLMAASLLLGLTSCGNDSDSDSTPEPVADTAIYSAQMKKSSTCGAYAMAYFLTRTGQIAESDIEKTANRFYSEVQFTEEEASGDYEFLEGYSNPVLIASKLKTTWAESANLKMLATASTEAEELLAGLASGLGITGITSLTSFDQGFSDSDYCIEIIKSGSSSLHYLLTYKKSGVLFSRDPADGKEYKRSEIQTAHPKYQFCNGGVFLKAYAAGTIPSLITVKASELEGLQDTLKAKQEAGFDFVTVKITDMTDAKEAMDWTTLGTADENTMSTLSEYADERFSTLLEAICAVQGETTMEMNHETGYCDFTFSGMAISLDLSETALTYLPLAAFCDLTFLNGGKLENVKMPVNLVELTLPETLTALFTYSFLAVGISDITIPKNVTVMMDAPFLYNSKLTMRFEEGTEITKINALGGEFSGPTEIIIPPSVTTIADRAFYKSPLQTIIFEEGSQLESIGEEAFYFNNLEEIALPASLKSIGDSAFDTSELTAITFAGTMAQWNAITKGTNWLDNANVSKVTCSDGEVSLTD